MVNGRGPTRRTILENAVHGALIISPLLAAPRGTGVLGKPCYDSHEPPRGAEGMSHIQPAPSKSMPSYSTEGDFQNEKMQYDVAYLAREDVRTSSGELSGKQEKHNIDLNVRGLQIHYESDVKLVFPFDRKDPYPIVGNSSAGDYLSLIHI